MKTIRAFALNSGAALLLGLFLAVGRADILYVANEVNNTIERFSSSGSDLGIFARDPLPGAAAFGLAFDSSANLFVAYANLPTNLTKFSATGAYLFSFAPGLGYLQGVAFDRAGNLYVANTTSDTIEKFSTGGTDLGTFASSGLSYPRGIAFDSAGNLYAANSGNSSIVKYSPAGTNLGTFASAPSANLSYPFGLAFDAAGNLYVADLLLNQVEKFSPTGTDLGTFASSGLSSPEGLAFDSTGNLYVANQGGSTIRKFTPTGVGSLFASNGVSGPTFLAFTDDAGKPLPLPPGVAATQARIAIVQPIVAGQALLRVTGMPGTNYTVQAATNLDSSAASWVSLVTSNSLTGTFDFLDTHATNPARFYRAAQ